MWDRIRKSLLEKIDGDLEGSLTDENGVLAAFVLQQIVDLAADEWSDDGDDVVGALRRAAQEVFARAEAEPPKLNGHAAALVAAPAPGRRAKAVAGGAR
ncbi:MAG TPA: hypothetical protein VNJ11_01100 [Bryobacteraceae bacterium]|nr:hypothetical protein [Bryobacteraceae bacterium]